MSELRKRLRVGAALAGVALVLLAPSIAWHLQGARTLSVVIVDKTVPFESYREHAAIPWILHAMKVHDPRGRFLDPAVDYVGFDPKAKLGHDLTPEALEHADALVVTDTYGVYRGDYEQPGDQAALERSPKIYGGFTEREVSAIDAFLGRGGLVLGEFNTFASPTEAPARAQLERLFGARWTKWVARYWPDLQDAREVPRWVGRLWERKMHAPFSMKGGGLVLVREDEDIVVLRDGEDLTSDVVTQQRTSRGAEFDLPARGAFRFWMDVVEPIDGEVLYEHVIGTKPPGAAKLEAHGVPSRFPALVRRGSAWYFAGDFVDNTLDLGSPELRGALAWRERTSGCGAGSSSEDAFFWGFYVPIVTRIFAARAR